MSCKIDPSKSQIIHNKSFITLAAVNKEGKLIGKADASILNTDRKFVWLHELKVTPKCRGQGVGSEIVDKLAEVGESENAKLIYAFPAQPVDENQPIPQKALDTFYNKNGFKPCVAPKNVFTVTDEGLESKGGVCKKL